MNALLKIYMQGFYDCPQGNDRSLSYFNLERKAYNLGWQDYIIGDDCPSLDYRSDEEILEIIHGESKSITESAGKG